MSNIKTVIGLMSGTSMDGIDAALLRTDGEAEIKLLAHGSFAYSPAFRTRLKAGLEEAAQIQSRDQRPGSLAMLEQDLTYYHGTLVRDMLRQENLDAQAVDLIGFHGQTMLHRPQSGLTVQLGDGALLAQETGIDVIFDMRAHDMSHGGQGAPLVPAYHGALAAQLGREVRFPVAFVNIGGIANLTYLQERELGEENDPIAFDCGPGNCLIDQWIEKMTGQDYDEGGRAGLAGKVQEEIVATYLSQPFFNNDKPHALDWRNFAPLEEGGISLEDGAATLSFVTAAGIFRSLRLLPQRPKTLIISGGGVKNRAIWSALQSLATKMDITIFSAQECGLHADFIEAEAWGYLAVRAWRRLPLTFPTTTGVASALTGGVFVAAPKKAGRNICTPRIL